MEPVIIRAVDRTAFWQTVITSNDKWLKAKWARRIKKFLAGKKLAVHGTAFLFPETPEPEIEEVLLWLEHGFELTHARLVTSEEAEAVGPEYAWSASDTGIGLIKCDEIGGLLKRTSEITLDDFVKFVEEEVWKKKLSLRVAVLAFLEIGEILLGKLLWGIKALKCSLLGI